MFLSYSCYFEINGKRAKSDKFSGRISLFPSSVTSFSFVPWWSIRGTLDLQKRPSSDLIWRGTSRDFFARSAASRLKKACAACKRVTCSKSRRGKELYFSLPSSPASLKMPRSPCLELAKNPRGFAACFTHLAAQESRQQRGRRRIGSAMFSKSFIKLTFSLFDVLGHLHLLRGVWLLAQNDHKLNGFTVICGLDLLKHRKEKEPTTTSWSGHDTVWETDIGRNPQERGTAISWIYMYVSLCGV